MTYESEILTPIGSVATSAAPVLANTLSICGNSLIIFSDSICILIEFSVFILAGRINWMAKSPSSNCGINSDPMRENMNTPETIAKIPIPKTIFLNLSPTFKAGLKAFSAILMRYGLSSLVLPLRKVAAKAGTKVNDSTSAEHSAIIKVCAIGPNILPSTPVNANNGINTIITINSPKPAADRISMAASVTYFLTSALVSSRPNRFPSF